ncbi:MFS transporter [Polaromonas sp.]|uniref:MFS transporter n=1 Tax=Polaromonas sp. TaxID=1869339 RepID=UPI003267F667
MTTPSTPPATARNALFRDRNFAWMMSGAALSMLGDQFSLIALPWLVLQMTGDTLVLGTVLALISVPRALFILAGGALVDRHSPKQVLMLTKHINTLLLGVLAALVLTDNLSLWLVYLLALGIGLATAFSIPSGTAMMPSVVRPEQLQAANSVMLGLRQVSMFLGPLLAGLLIALSGNREGAGASGAVPIADATGIGLAFAFDAFTFALSAWTLSKVQQHARAAGPGAAGPAVLTAIAEGLRAFWRDVPLRTCFLYWAAIAVLVTGPVQIALPVLASSQPNLGAAALGVMLGAHGAGTLLGMVLAGIKPRLRVGTLGTTILLVDALVGLLFIPMGQISAAWQGAALLLAIGLLSGFLHVAVFTWLQRRVPPALLGRAMSLFMFIFMGLAPMSAALTGWVLRSLSLGQLFAASGGLLVAITVLTFAASQMRQVSDAPMAGADARR